MFDDRNGVRVTAYTDATELGGAERALATLVRGLDDRIDLTVAGTDPAIVNLVAAGRDGARTRIVRAARGKSDVRGSLAHLRLMRELRPQVLHANLRNPWSCQYALAAGLLTRGVRTLAVQHAISPPQRRRQLWLNKLNLSRVDAQIAVSKATAQFLEQTLGEEPDTVRVIYDGVPDLSGTARPRVAEGPVVGYVGRLSPEKGVDVLLQAVRALPGVTVVLVGDGPERTRLERLGRELGIAPRMIMTGWQANSRPWLPSIDVLALPSRLEGLGMAAVEAMLAQRPVVASRVGGTPEVVVDGETGLLVPPEDPDALAGALGSLLGEPSRRERMGMCGREVALERFGVERMLRSYEAVYDELVLLSSRATRMAKTAIDS